VKIGESIQYECEEGKHQVGGDVQLHCVLITELVTEWRGEPLICKDRTYDTSSKIVMLTF